MRSFAVAIFLSGFAVVASAQTPLTPSATPQSGSTTRQARCKEGGAQDQSSREATGFNRDRTMQNRRDVSRRQQNCRAESGSRPSLKPKRTKCRSTGVSTRSEFSTACVRQPAAIPGVRRIAYPKGVFEPYYHPTSRFLPDPREGLPAIVREHYAKCGMRSLPRRDQFKGQLPGTNLMLDGIGTYNRGLGTIIRHSHLFANISVTLLDGGTYERINRQFANFGREARGAKSFQVGEDDLTKLDNSLFPEPAAAAASSTTLRGTTPHSGCGTDGSIPPTPISKRNKGVAPRCLLSLGS